MVGHEIIPRDNNQNYNLIDLEWSWIYNNSIVEPRKK